MYENCHNNRNSDQFCTTQFCSLKLSVHHNICLNICDFSQFCLIKHSLSNMIWLRIWWCFFSKCHFFSRLVHYCQIVFNVSAIISVEKPRWSHFQNWSKKTRTTLVTMKVKWYIFTEINSNSKKSYCLVCVEVSFFLQNSRAHSRSVGHKFQK